MAKIISVINQKGGVGKTTTTINLGMALKKAGKKVLLVDLDPQANLSSSLGINHRNIESSVYDLLKGEAEYSSMAVNIRGVMLVPASLALSGADIELSQYEGRELMLKNALSCISDRFDFVLIDCPPTLGLLTLNALTASDGLIIPVQAEYLPLEGISFLVETVEIVKERLNSRLEVIGVVVTRYNARQKLQKEVVSVLGDHFGDKLYKTFIRSNVSLAEAPSFGQDIFTYRPQSSGAKDYRKLCKEFLSKGEF
jgi:chromosome partitioning protein